MPHYKSKSNEKALLYETSQEHERDLLRGSDEERYLVKLWWLAPDPLIFQKADTFYSILWLAQSL